MSSFIGLAYKGKDIVFRFIIECSSLRDFDPQVISLFLYEDFLKDDILACAETCDQLQSYNILKDFGFLLDDVLKIIFLQGEIFEFP